ncbi:Ribosomal RNA small subunit methyltransferase F [bacterium HR21]|nr:Ribosomal RNA small subunit methyltransferase F [bacterium HR21]
MENKRRRLEEAFARYMPLIEEPQAFWQCVFEPLQPCLWVNPLKTTLEAFHAYCREHGILLEPISWYPGAFRVPGLERPGATLPFVAGWYYVQEEIAMAAVVALDPQPGERIVDLCAAPGGKTAQIALRVRPNGMVVANEAAMERLSGLRTTVDRLGLLNVVVTWGDGRRLPLPEGVWDRVLVDAPCTGEGTVRKMKQGWRPVHREFRQYCSALQRALLRRALQLVKPGGIVVYSTCTFAPEENELVLDAVLGDYGVVEPFSVAGLRSAPGIRQWMGKELRSDVVNACRFWPHLNNTGGFFLARIRRTDVPMPPLGKVSCPGRAPLQPAQRLDGIAWLCERFGLEPELFAAYRYWMRGREKLWMAIPEVEPPVELPPESVGIALLSYKREHVKPKTFALQLFGKSIRRNVVELPEEQAAIRFVSGQSQNVLTDVEPGFVHVRYREFELGCGLYARGQLHSQIPRSLHTMIADHAGV